MKIRELAGEVSDIRQQASVYLTRARIHMIPDYIAFDKELDSLIYYEFKGLEMPTYRIKRKLWMFYGPAPLWVYKTVRGACTLTEIIIPDNEQSET